MEEDLCKVCKKNKAIIYINGVGTFCSNCHNCNMIKRYGLEDTFDYTREISLLDSEGESHEFKIEHIILGDVVSWNAYGQNDKYHFNQITKIDENGYIAAQRFIQKISDGINAKTKDTRGHCLKDKGTINIVENEDNGFKIGFEIDGTTYTPDDFAELLSPYVGFSMQYQIHDASDPILKDEEYLVPIKITKESLIEDLYMALNIYSDSGFISYKDVPAFDEAVFPIFSKLEVLANNGKRDIALETGKDLVKIICSIQTDDDYFPIYHLDNIKEIVDPQGVNQELTEAIKSYYEF